MNHCLTNHIDTSTCRKRECHIFLETIHSCMLMRWLHEERSSEDKRRVPQRIDLTKCRAGLARIPDNSHGELLRDCSRRSKSKLRLASAKRSKKGALRTLRSRPASKRSPDHVSTMKHSYCKCNRITIRFSIIDCCGALRCRGHTVVPRVSTNSVVLT